jgi:hypothetical protein
MSEGRWIQTDKHVFGAIFREHKNDLVSFAGFSNPSPSDLSETPQMMTEWGFRGADFPLIKLETKWEHGRREATESSRYFIFASTRG